MNLTRIITFLFATSISVSVYAQETESNVKLERPFRADGISNEWNEPLNQYNTDTKLAFALANDDKNLYLIIESLDPATTRTILFGGITLNINTAGKKKNAINLVFPFREKPQKPKAELSEDSLKLDEMTVRKPPNANGAARNGIPPVGNHGLKVSGFKNIEDGVITNPNAFGIESGMAIKPNQDLIYEIVIPLTELGINADWKKAIAYNIKLNTTKAAGGEHGKGGPPGGGAGRQGGGMGGPGGGMGGGGGMMGGGQKGGGQRPPEGAGESDTNKKSDFWIKYKLVKA